MATKVLEQVGTTLYRLINVESWHASSRTSRHSVIITSEDHARFIKDFCEARSNDSDNSTMPFFVEKDDRLVFVTMFESLYNTVRLLSHRLVQVLSLLVVFVYLLCFLFGSLGIFLDEKCYGFISRLHSARSIYARSYLKDNVSE